VVSREVIGGRDAINRVCTGGRRSDRETMRFGSSNVDINKITLSLLHTMVIEFSLIPFYITNYN
jgi:hypothetical protein